MPKRSKKSFRFGEITASPYPGCCGIGIFVNVGFEVIDKLKQPDNTYEWSWADWNNWDTKITEHRNKVIQKITTKQLVNDLVPILFDKWSHPVMQVAIPESTPIWRATLAAFKEIGFKEVSKSPSSHNRGQPANAHYNVVCLTMTEEDFLKVAKKHGKEKKIRQVFV